MDEGLTMDPLARMTCLRQHGSICPGCQKPRDQLRHLTSESRIERRENEVPRIWVTCYYAYDRRFDKLHSTTYAVEPSMKDVIARMVPTMLDSVGANTSTFHAYEDFRLRTQAESAKEIADLKNEIDRLKGLLPQAQTQTDSDVR